MCKAKLQIRPSKIARSPRVVPPRCYLSLGLLGREITSVRWREETATAFNQANKQGCSLQKHTVLYYGAQCGKPMQPWLQKQRALHDIMAVISSLERPCFSWSVTFSRFACVHLHVSAVVPVNQSCSAVWLLDFCCSFSYLKVTHQMFFIGLEALCDIMVML